MENVAIKTFLELGKIEDNGFQSFGFDLIELNHFNYSLMRGLDPRGKIQTDLRGGSLSFVADMLPTPVMLEWALRSNKFFSGIVHFRDSMGQPVDKLYFENAACVYFKLSYMNAGSGYFSVQCGLQAQALSLSSLNFLNEWPGTENMSKSPSASIVGKSQAGNMVREALNQQFDLNADASLTGYMELFGGRYELKSFEMEFVQDIDFRGQPQSGVKGGVASVSLFSLPDPKLNKWLLRPEGENGQFLFGDPMRGYNQKIGFTEARCIGFYAETRLDSDYNVETRLNLLPLSLDFENGLFFEPMFV